jgi:hypothetical protein
VAIGVGPFVYSICLSKSVFTWPKFKNRFEEIRSIRSPQTS